MTSIISLLHDRDHASSAVWRFPTQDLTVSLRELSNSSRAYARELRKHSVDRGDRVGFVVENSYDLVCLLFATWHLNAVAVPLRPRPGRFEDHRTYVKKCDAVCGLKLIVTDGEALADELSSWADSNGKHVVPVQAIAERVLREPYGSGATPCHIDPQDTAIIQFSSGSTGDPKGVVVTHAMMMAQLQNMEDNHARSRGRKVASSASWLPINHDLGLFSGVLSPVFSACDNLLAPPSYYMKNPARWFSLLAKHRVDFTFSTNSVLASSLGTLRVLRNPSATDLSSLHLYIAAEKVSPIVVRRTWRALETFGCPKENVHVGYGMAENTLGATYTSGGPIKTCWFVLDGNARLTPSEPSDPGAFELASIGIPNDHHTVTVRDRNDAILPDLRLGELSIESPCVSPGYYNDPVATAAKLGDDRLRTGDLGFRYDGEFFFYSRKDDLLVTNGRNVVPDDIELTAETLEFVRPLGTALLGVEDERLGITQLHLLVEGDPRLSQDDIHSHCIALRKHILDAHDILITNIAFCAKGNIEKTSSGKKRRKVIRRRLLESEIAMLPRTTSISHQHTSIQSEQRAAV